MILLRIKNWASNFENNRTRDLKRMDWVPVPNKMDGDGFTELMDHENGTAHYGAWLLIVGVASKCGERGTLSREGAVPHDARSLARVTRGSEAIFKEAIPRLISIGWLEVIGSDSATSDNPAPSCGETAPRCGEVPMEWKGMEGKRSTPISPTGGSGGVLVLNKPAPELGEEEFAKEIFALYPRGDDKAKSITAIIRAFEDITPMQLRLKVEEYSKAVANWPQDDRRYIPCCRKWIRNKRWMDDPASWGRQSTEKPHDIAAQLKAVEAEIEQRTTEEHVIGDNFRRVSKPGMEARVKELFAKRKELRAKLTS